MKSINETTPDAEVIFSNDNCIFSNSTHQDGNISYLTAEPITERYLFGRFNKGRVMPAGEGDVAKGYRAIGVISDSGAKGELVNLQVMGSGASTLEVVAGDNITSGDLITANAASKAVHYMDMPAGSYFVYGIALSDAVAGQTVEFTPTPGLEKKVIANKESK